MCMQAEQYVVKELAAAAKSNKLKGFERIAAVHLEPEAFSAENGLMTPSFKLKRPQLQKHYQKLIDECAFAARVDMHTHLTVHGAGEAAPEDLFEISECARDGDMSVMSAKHGSMAKCSHGRA